MLITESKKKLGYVPEKDNIVFARLMDEGKLLVGRITSISKRAVFIRLALEYFWWIF